MVKTNGISVREFDKIICGQDNSIDDGYKKLSEKDFKELVQFVKEFNEGDTAASDLLKIGYSKRRDTVSINNYVGVIELPSGFQIEVLPKVDFKDKSSDDDKTRRVFVKMLRSLKDFQGKVFADASLKTDNMNLYEIFISMYVKEVQRLVKQGIQADYREISDNLGVFKGKLDVSHHIVTNVVHKEKFYVTFDEYSVNRPENRIIKSTLIKLMKKSSSEKNVREIRQLLSSFEQVDVSYNYDDDFLHVGTGRSIKTYENILTWSKIFLYDKNFSVFSGKTKSKAILFPMEQIFEKYIAKWVCRIFGERGWKVSIQDDGYYLFDEPQMFSLRPDIILRRGDITVIMDTKWKRLDPNARNSGISQADMYQMYAYSKKYAQYDRPVPEVWLLYPYDEKSSQIEEKTFSSSDGVKVHIYFADVDETEKSIRELMKEVDGKLSPI